MADITYSVNVEYVSTGSLHGIEKSMHMATASMAGLSHALHSVNRVFDGVVGSLVGIADSAAKSIATVVAGSFALAAKEAIHFNSEMETAQVGMAAVANSMQGLNGFTDPQEAFGNQFRLAGDVLRKMRQDARELPGEFKDLQNIFSTIHPITAQHGFGMMGTETMAAQVMTAAAIKKVGFDIAARETRHILEGRARGNMPFFQVMALGNSTEWNKLKPDERIAKFQERLSSIGIASESIKDTWSVISTNFTDIVRQAAGGLFGPTFERLKGALKLITDQDQRPQLDEYLKRQWHTSLDELNDRAIRASFSLVHAFEAGGHFLEKWIPVANQFVHTIWNGLEGLFRRLGIDPHRVGDTVQSFMTSPRAFDKFEHAAEIMMGLRVGTGVAGFAANLAPGLIMGAGAMGIGGSTMLALAGPIAAGAAAIAAASAMFAYNVLHGSEEAVKVFKNLSGGLSNIGKNIFKIAESLEPMVSAWSTAAFAYLQIPVALFEFLSKIGALIATIPTSIREWWNGKLPNASDDVDAKAFQELGDKNQALREQAMEDNIMSIKKFNTTAEYLAKVEKPPQNTTHIHRVEIKVNSNQDPNRIAREVHGLLTRLGRTPLTTNTPASQFAR